jgi:hypothetical protein
METPKKACLPGSVEETISMNPILLEVVAPMLSTTEMA